MSQGFTTAPLSNISNVSNLQPELDSKAALSGATFTGLISGGSVSIGSITSNTVFSTTVSATTVTGTNFYGNGSTLTGVITEFTGVTSISFVDALISGETSFASTTVSDSNITANSNLMFWVSASTNHLDVEDSLLDGLMLKESSLNPGVGFTVNATAINDSWGIYNIKYKIIN